MKRILIMGLPGTGKTTCARELKKRLEKAGKSVAWYNADDVRQTFNDWDFSYDGRLRQADRMKILADMCETDFVICDFVAPLKIMRDRFNSHYTIWMDTEKTSNYKDTNKIFEEPETYTVRIVDKNAEEIVADILHRYFKLD